MLERFTQLFKSITNKQPAEVKDYIVDTKDTAVSIYTAVVNYDDMLKLIESFKKNKISLLIEYVNKTAFNAIQSQYASPEIAQYFPDIDQYLKKVNPEGPPFSNFDLEPDNISQIKKLLNALYYAHLTFKDLENIDIRDASRFTSNIKLLLSRTIETAYEASYLATHLDVDIKALFQEELDFLLSYLGKIQNYAKDQAQDLKGYIDKTRKNIKNACYLTLSLDVNLRNLPKGDLDLIQLHLANIEHFAENHTETLQELINKAQKDTAQPGHLKVKLGIKVQGLSQTDQDFIQLHLTPIEKLVSIEVKEIPLPYTVGEKTGIAAHQMRPLDGDVDYNFLTKFSGNLPSYINELTNYIQEYSSQIKENEPKLNQKKLDELRLAALSLLNDITKLQGNNLFVSLRFLNYIHIIRNIITISMSIMDEVGELTDSSQDLVREKLALLKYNILPTLFGVVDKIEVNTMVKPGTLSTPLMEQIQKLYQALLYFPKKAIDFKEKGEELLSIEDSRFIELRLELAYKRINTAAKVSSQTNKIQTAANAFFTELEKSEYQAYSLAQLPEKVKEGLITNYKIIKPLMAQLDVNFDKQITTSLLSSESWSSYFNRPLRWVGGTLPADHISLVLAQKEALQDLITKNQNSQQFHTKLNENLIDFVHTETKLVLFPYVDTAEVYALDESIPLGINRNEINLKLKKAEFEPLLNAFIRLSALITHQINADNKAPTDTLSLDALDETTRTQLNDLYKQLQLYFSYLVPPKQKNNALQFERYLTAILENKSISTKGTPAVELFLTLAQQTQNALVQVQTSWTDKTEVYYDLSKAQFLTQEESAVLRRKEDKKLKFTESATTKDILLDNPEHLSADQAQELCEWYNHKQKKFAAAKEKYTQFIGLLNTHQIKGNVLNIVGLKDNVKDELRKLYNIVQPYFMGTLPKADREWAIKFDKYLVAILSNRAIDLGNAPTMDRFFNYNTQLTAHFVEVDQKLRQKSENYEKIAQERFHSENEAATFALNTNKDPRAHHLLKNTNISQGIHEFRTDLSALVRLFNKTMQKELTPQAKGIPYPEMENAKDANIHLLQSEQVRAIKDLYNSLFHLEGIAKRIETLTNDNLPIPEQEESYAKYGNVKYYYHRLLAEVTKGWTKSKKVIYVYHLIQAYSHIDEIKKLSLRLASDPHYGLLAKELISKAQNIYANLQEQTEAYQTGAEQIPLEGTVQYSALWYALNAFYISPKHIRALNNINYLTTEELNALHERAKKATLTIEGLINSADSYFKLFLQTPSMLLLYKELKQKLNEFTTTAHDGVLTNLENIRPSLLTPMLLEADHWEDKLGLAPGSFSEPLRKITDEYYKGLLHPLNLSSKKYIALVNDNQSLIHREAAIAKEIEKAEKGANKIEQSYAGIVKLRAMMKIHRDLADGTFIAPAEYINLSKKELQEQYKQVLPRLARLKAKQKIYTEVSIYDEDHFFDNLCNEGLKDWEPHFTEIEELVEASHHYYVGLKATYEMRVSTAKEKQAYFKELARTQEQEQQEFIENYTDEAFGKHLDTCCNHPIGLLYTDTEYYAALKTELLLHKAQIINASKTAEDINLNISNLLKEKISAFEKKHYVDYYHLDSVRHALLQFRSYCNYCTEKKDSLFEDKDTLDKKSTLLKELEQIATNARLSIKERLKEIRKEVKDPNFERIILAYKHHDTFSIAYLKMCFFLLLEALHLFTPTRKKRLNALNEAVDNQPKIDDLVSRFGLFSTPTSPTSQPSMSDDTPPLPATGPGLL
ncbi:hypothetical protein [Legionella drancourtii]|uniref:SdhA, substrate of the Dot/Icm system n=1 Tax=Legionella drancourtii LLAP12 TaxID=658187 RepID=G9ESZ0_9GAMM|nr:hypothetical protein [Legionella drancourtii]EHL29457.1 hypothetical protein LDG_8419 [Legionella drancourtii LLAP12]